MQLELERAAVCQFLSCHQVTGTRQKIPRKTGLLQRCLHWLAEQDRSTDAGQNKVQMARR